MVNRHCVVNGIEQSSVIAIVELLVVDVTQTSTTIYCVTYLTQSSPVQEDDRHNLVTGTAPLAPVIQQTITDFCLHPVIM